MAKSTICSYTQDTGLSKKYEDSNWSSRTEVILVKTRCTSSRNSRSSPTTVTKNISKPGSAKPRSGQLKEFPKLESPCFVKRKFAWSTPDTSSISECPSWAETTLSIDREERKELRAIRRKASCSDNFQLKCFKEEPYNEILHVPKRQSKIDKKYQSCGIKLLNASKEEHVKNNLKNTRVERSYPIDRSVEKTTPNFSCSSRKMSTHLKYFNGVNERHKMAIEQKRFSISKLFPEIPGDQLIINDSESNCYNQNKDRFAKPFSQERRKFGTRKQRYSSSNLLEQDLIKKDLVDNILEKDIYIPMQSSTLTKNSCLSSHIHQSSPKSRSPDVNTEKSKYAVAQSFTQ